MAVTKLWPVRNRLDHVLNYAKDPEKTARQGGRFERENQSLQDVLAYAKDEEKTERELFCEGINSIRPRLDENKNKIVFRPFQPASVPEP